MSYAREASVIKLAGFDRQHRRHRPARSGLCSKQKIAISYAGFAIGGGDERMETAALVGHCCLLGVDSGAEAESVNIADQFAGIRRKPGSAALQAKSAHCSAAG
ncbi:hypothetical protein DEA98_25665 [Brucella pseudogrignonensis]|nr:hypothetical protein [Brucella pseudogrignonensis]